MHGLNFLNMGNAALFILIVVCSCYFSSEHTAIQTRANFNAKHFPIAHNVLAMCSAGFRSLSYSLPSEPNLIFSLITILPNQRFGEFKKAQFCLIPDNRPHCI
jgi:hypothetical protein